MNNQNYLIYFKRKNSLSLSNTESFRDLFPSMRLNLAHTIEEVLNQNRSNTLTIWLRKMNFKLVSNCVIIYKSKGNYLLSKLN